MLKDNRGNKVEEGSLIQFDSDYFGHGLTRIVKKTTDGILGFEAVPNVSEKLCYLEVWLDSFQVVEKEVHTALNHKHITTSGQRHFL